MQSRSMFTMVSDFWILLYTVISYVFIYLFLIMICLFLYVWWHMSQRCFLHTSRSLVSTGCSRRELLTTYCSRGSSPLWLLLRRTDWQSPTHKVNRYYWNYINHCWGNESMHIFRIGEPTVLLYRAGLLGWHLPAKKSQLITALITITLNTLGDL